MFVILGKAMEQWGKVGYGIEICKISNLFSDDMMMISNK